MRRLALLGLVLTVGCGGGAAPTTSAPTPSPRAPEALDVAGFEARVLGSSGAALVEFQRPT